jgi:hypothetical protein
VRLIGKRGISVRLCALLVLTAGVTVLLPSTAEPRIVAARSGPWTGVVTFTADLDHTFNGTNDLGGPLTLTATYHERAVFTLSGRHAGRYSSAVITGSGTGSARFSGGTATTCARDSDPWSEWSFAGQGLIAVWYEAGRLFVIPRIQMQTVSSVFTGCGSVDEAAARIAPVPVFYLGIVRSISGETIRPNARAVSGSTRIPIRMSAVGLAEIAGTVTLSWRLHRHGGATGP